MPHFKTSRRVAVPPDIAFAVAADVAGYGAFLPLLQRSQIVGRKTVTATGETFLAELAVAYPKLGLSGAFISRVETNAISRTVGASSNDAPFRHISTLWTITAAGEDSDVAIAIDYAFRNPFLQVAAAGLMDIAVRKVLQAFETRAIEVYRKASSRS